MRLRLLAAFTLTTVLVMGLPLMTAAPVLGLESSKVTIEATDNRITYRESTRIQGEVQDSEEFWIAYVTVNLQRRLAGRSRWVTVESDDTDYWGEYRFTVTPVQNTLFRVKFVGEEGYARSFSREITVRVYRRITSSVSGMGDGQPPFYFNGRVTPNYAHRRAYFTVRRCGSCAWRTVASQLTNSRGGFRFNMPPPRAVGSVYHYRVRVPASIKFLKSISEEFDIQRLM